VDVRLVNYFRWISESRLQALYTPTFRARLGNAQAMAPMLEFLQPLSAQAEPLERMLALEQRFFLADHNLIYTDKMSMAVGVEVGWGFGAPLRRWVRHDLRELLGDVLSAESLKYRGLFEPVAVQLRAACSVDASYTLLSLLCIEIWCRTFLDGIPSKSPPTPLSQRGGFQS